MASEREAARSFYCPAESISEGSDDGQVAGPIRVVGNASVMMYLRRKNNTCRFFSSFSEGWRGFLILFRGWWGPGPPGTGSSHTAGAIEPGPHSCCHLSTAHSELGLFSCF